MIDSNSPHLSNGRYSDGRRHIPRILVFIAGIILGVVLYAGIRQGYAKIEASREQGRIKPWNTTAFTFKGFHDGFYFIHNGSGKDHSFDPFRVFVMQRIPLGLVPTGSKLSAGVFIPAGDSAGISFNPPLKGSIVIFDAGGKYRIDTK